MGSGRANTHAAQYRKHVTRNVGYGRADNIHQASLDSDPKSRNSRGFPKSRTEPNKRTFIFSREGPPATRLSLGIRTLTQLEHSRAGRTAKLHAAYRANVRRKPNTEMVLIPLVCPVRWLSLARLRGRQRYHFVPTNFPPFVDSMLPAPRVQ